MNTSSDRRGMPKRLQDAIDACQMETIKLALDRCGGHRGRAAETLGIHRNSLTRLCTQLGIAADYGLEGRTKVGRP